MLRAPVLVSALLLLPCAPARGAEEEPSPAALGRAVASQILTECEAAGASSAALSIAGAPGLEGVPALVAAARAIEDRVFPASGRGGLTAAPPESADVEIELVLARSHGRVTLGGAVRRTGGRASWVLASVEETPAWAPWLDGIAPALADPRGFTWRRLAAIPGDVLDADAGDLDGDGSAEIVAVTRTEALVLRVRGSDAAIAARTALAPMDAADVATRAPRAFVRVVPGAGGPGEVIVRFTDEKRARVLAWDAAGARLEARSERDGVVLASRLTTRGADEIALEVGPGTNHFVDPPKVRRNGSWKQPASLATWLDLREADLTATARIAESGAVYALLDGDGALRLLRSDLTELSRVAACGSAFALTDWDADGKADALCAGGGAPVREDTLALTGTNGAKWSGAVDGPVAAIAAGPQAPGATAAIVFVRDGSGAPGTALWLLTRRAP